MGAPILAGAELLLLRRSAAAEDPFEGGKLIGTLPFQDEGRAPLDTLLGDELDGRQFTDLSHVDGDELQIPTSQFYVRTRASHLLDTGRPWSIRTGAARIAMDELRRQAGPQGLHLMECAGNTRTAHFGMIGAASWDGAPLLPLLDRLRFDPADRILVSGFDQYQGRPLTPSVPGASWIFSRRELAEARAFLAVGINGRPLTPDHGAPVRLVVPGWYGCASIKWVNGITPVGDAAEATSQMREYASRTMQHGTPARARDYQPAIIDPAAMPVRIEEWRVGGRTRFRVIGIVWGGRHLADKLTIRFRPEEPDMPVERVLPAAQSPWGLWTHTWMPRQPGIYRIGLRLADSSIRARRLDAGYYIRQVRIERL
jgi:hypothetical protein